MAMSVRFFYNMIKTHTENNLIKKKKNSVLLRNCTPKHNENVIY